MISKNVSKVELSFSPHITLSLALPSSWIQRIPIQSTWPKKGEVERMSESTFCGSSPVLSIWEVTFLLIACSTASSIDGRGSVSISNMRNARISSYKLVIQEGINLKRVLNIDDILFGQFSKCSI